MQILNCWPSNNALSLPKCVKQALLTHLIEPFGDEQSAKAFWQEYPSTILIMTSEDKNACRQLLSDETQQQIEFAFNYPEYLEPLVDDYVIRLSITNDEGSGIYIVSPTSYSPHHTNMGDLNG